MRGVVRTLLSLTLVALIATCAGAQEKKGQKGKGKKKDQAPQAVRAIKEQLAKVDLSADQAEKVEKLFAEFSPKLAAAQQKISGVITAEQRQAMQEARKKAAEEGKKGKELEAAAQAVLNLSAEKKAALDKSQAESRELTGALRKQVLALLTPEQREKVDLTVRGAGGEGRKGQGGARQGKKAKKDGDN